MESDPIAVWTAWARAFNARDWQAWDEVIAPDFHQVNNGITDSDLVIDKERLRRIHESATNQGFMVRILSVSAIGSAIATTFELVNEQQDRTMDAAILLVDAEGRLAKAYDFSATSHHS